MAKQKKEILLLVDSHALIHRAYHAFPPTLRTRDGKLVNAVYGFVRLLLDVLHKFQPKYVIAAMDAKGKTVRHHDYGAYKANRKPIDDDLVQQIPDIEQILVDFDIPMLKIPGYEADDIIGTLDKQFADGDKDTIIVTGDRDLLQLVDDNTFVYLAGSSFSKSQLHDAESVKEKLGIGPEFVIDFKGLAGDASDNIPGVAGIGQKSAVDLINKFGHLDDIYQHLGEIEKRYVNKLQENFEIAKLSQKLATIITDVPMSFDFTTATFGTFDAQGLEQKFRDLEFNSLLRDLAKLVEQHQPKPDGQNSAQLSLLGGNSAPAADNIKLPAWTAKAIPADTKQVFVSYSLNQLGDPLHWQLQELFVTYDDSDEVLSVQMTDAAQFFSKISGKTLVTIESKPLLHAVYNLGIKPDFQIYDLGLSTYLVSKGRAKQSVEGVLLEYKQDSFMSKTKLPQAYKEVYQQQVAMLDGDQLAEVVHMENELVPVVADMERNGIVLNKEKIVKFTKDLQIKLQELTAEIYREVGHEFNIASPKQVGEVLFGEKGLPAMKKTKSGTYSTDERSLRELIGVDPLVKMILDYRELAKLLSTYLVPLPELINKETGRIHASFNQIGAITGRFSSQNPNMQNIPVGTVADINIRSAFEAAEGSVLVAFDYSQQELRLLAELSGEENMRKAFQQNLDIHAVAASEIFDIPINEVDKDKRRIGKTINFGIVYGISAFGLADRLKIGQKQAAEYIQKYFAEYPEVKNYYRDLIEKSKISGEVSTILGRKRSTIDLTTKNYQVRAAAEREVMNFPLQGSAADIIKKAMVTLGDVQEKFPAKMLLQVHDELIFEYPWSGKLTDLPKDADFQKFVKYVQGKMLSAVELEIPFDVGVEIGTNWGESEEIA